MTPSQRVREFPTEQLTVSASKLFCTACREELAYLAKTADVSPDFDCLKWWERNCGDLPNWSSAALKVLLVQPSSAAAERVFSLLSDSFSDRQQNLEDYVEASLMLQYNKRSLSLLFVPCIPAWVVLLLDMWLWLVSLLSLLFVPAWVVLLHVLDIICGCEHNGFSFEHN